MLISMHGVDGATETGFMSVLTGNDGDNEWWHYTLRTLSVGWDCILLHAIVFTLFVSS